MAFDGTVPTEPFSNLSSLLSSIETPVNSFSSSKSSVNNSAMNATERRQWTTATRVATAKNSTRSLLSSTTLSQIESLQSQTALPAISTTQPQAPTTMSRLSSSAVASSGIPTAITLPITSTISRSTSFHMSAPSPPEGSPPRASKLSGSLSRPSNFKGSPQASSSYNLSTSLDSSSSYPSPDQITSFSTSSGNGTTSPVNSSPSSNLSAPSTPAEMTANPLANNTWATRSDVVPETSSTSIKNSQTSVTITTSVSNGAIPYRNSSGNLWTTQNGPSNTRETISAARSLAESSWTYGLPGTKVWTNNGTHRASPMDSIKATQIYSSFRNSSGGGGSYTKPPTGRGASITSMYTSTRTLMAPVSPTWSNITTTIFPQPFNGSTKSWNGGTAPLPVSGKSSSQQATTGDLISMLPTILSSSPRGRSPSASSQASQAGLDSSTRKVTLVQNMTSIQTQQGSPSTSVNRPLPSASGWLTSVDNPTEPTAMTAKKPSSIRPTIPWIANATSSMVANGSLQGFTTSTTATINQQTWQTETLARTSWMNSSDPFSSQPPATSKSSAPPVYSPGPLTGNAPGPQMASSGLQSGATSSANIYSSRNFTLHSEGFSLRSTPSGVGIGRQTVTVTYSRSIGAEGEQGSDPTSGTVVSRKGTCAHDVLQTPSQPSGKRGPEACVAVTAGTTKIVRCKSNSSAASAVRSRSESLGCGSGCDVSATRQLFNSSSSGSMGKWEWKGVLGGKGVNARRRHKGIPCSNDIQNVSHR